MNTCLTTTPITLNTLNQIACEGFLLTINCPLDQTIQITTATYGRTDNSTCYSNAEQCAKTNCMLDVTSIVSNYCQSKTNCILTASINTFGYDPCAGTYKYTKLDYNCVTKSTSSK